jgi:hypothetical protein
MMRLSRQVEMNLSCRDHCKAAVKSDKVLTGDVAASP